MAVTPSTRRMRTSISTTSGRCAPTAVDHLVAVVALGHDLEAVVGPEDAGDAGPHDRLVVDDEDPDHVRHGVVAGAAATGRRASTRQPSGGRAGLELAAEGPGPLPHARRGRSARRRRSARAAGPAVVDDDEVDLAHRRRRRASSTRLPAAWRATLASASRAMRCRAVPIGPSMAAGVRPRRRPSTLEPGPPVLVDQHGQVGRAGQRRVGAPLVGAQGGHRGPDLVEARPADRLGVDAAPARPRRRRGAARGGRR